MGMALPALLNVGNENPDTRAHNQRVVSPCAVDGSSCLCTATTLLRNGQQ